MRFDVKMRGGNFAYSGRPAFIVPILGVMIPIKGMINVDVLSLKDNRGTPPWLTK
jgi:hypothetical protein